MSQHVSTCPCWHWLIPVNKPKITITKYTVEIPGITENVSVYVCLNFCVYIIPKLVMVTLRVHCEPLNSS